MSAADGFLTPAESAARAQLEQRYRRLMRLYPHEFRARRADEMLGVLMASAADGQDRPARGDVRDVVRGSLAMRLRGPRGGWSFTLAAFALVAPLFLLLTDILQVAFPYWESQASWQRRISLAENIPVIKNHMGVLPPLWAQRQHAGGLQLLGQPVFLLVVAGHLIVAAAVLNGLRRTALAALVIAAAAYATHWPAFVSSPQSSDTLADLTTVVFLLEAIALAVADPRAARRREGWQHVIPALVLAFAAQAWVLAFDASHIGGRNRPLVDTLMVTVLVLVALGVLMPLPLALGWRTSLLLAAACDSVLAGAVYVAPLGSPVSELGLRVTGPGPGPAAHAPQLVLMYLPLLLVLSWAVAQSARARRTRNRGDLAA